MLNKKERELLLSENVNELITDKIIKRVRQSSENGEPHCIIGLGESNSLNVWVQAEESKSLNDAELKALMIEKYKKALIS